MSTPCVACGADLPASPERMSYPSTGHQNAGEILPEAIEFCPHCGFGTAVPMPSSDDLDAFYAGQYWADLGAPPAFPRESELVFQLAKNRLEFLFSHCEPSARQLTLLDVGAGHGCLGMAADPSQLEHYVAVETDPMMRDVIRNAWSDNSRNAQLTVVEKIEELSQELKIDVVVLSHLLEHVPDPIAFLEVVTQNLKPNGLLMIDVPNADWRFKNDVFPHLVFFTKHSLAKLLGRAGFAVAEVDIFGRAPVKNQEQSLPYRIGNRVLRSLPQMEGTWNQALYGPGKRNPNGVWLRAVARRER